MTRTKASSTSSTASPQSSNTIQASSSSSMDMPQTTSTSPNNDSVHLVNCAGSDEYSVVVYCADDLNCDFPPSSSNYIQVGTGDEYYTWEQQNQSVTFSTGVTFNWTINSDGNTAPNYTPQGSGSNGFKPFTCYKDDQHLMYNDDQGNKCDSVYYCVQ
ncbi:hypothetical protein GGR51DRAFT_192805 [Nemania sp. FL0031]|nr:hypothetical protein GGR51DRAFT_192805 [Nemania sp. FL0031]